MSEGCWEGRETAGQFYRHEGAFEARCDGLAASRPVSPQGPGQTSSPSLLAIRATEALAKLGLWQSP